MDAQDIRLSKLESAYKIMAAIGAVVIFVLTFLQDWITKHLP